jgi:hypothetical protein
VVEALSVGALASTARLRLELLAVQIFGLLHDWPKVQRHAKAALEADPSHVGAAWALVYALHNQRLMGEALEALNAYKLVARDEDEATCALVIWRQHSDLAQAIDASVVIARAFSESEQVVGTALLSSLDLSARMPEDGKPDPAVSRALAELSENFFASWPESDMVTRISAESPEGLVEHMQDIVRQGAPPSELVDLAKSAQLGVAPLGLVSALVGRPLSEMVIGGASGAVPLSAADAGMRSAEDSDAAGAIDGEVVCDVHTAVVLASLNDSLRPKLVDQFTRLRVPFQIVDDVLDGTDRLQRRSTGTLTWDESEGRMRLIEIPADEADAMAMRALRVSELVRSMLAEAVPLDEAFTVPRLGVVLAPIELARRRGLPIWSDDPGLRATARGEGLRAFGTMSLVGALLRAGDISQLQAHGIQSELLAEGFDVDAETDVLLGFLKSTSFTFPALSLLARRSVWSNPERGLELLHAGLEAVGSTNWELWRSIVAAAAYGAASAVATQTQTDVLVSVGLSSVFRSDDQVAAFPEMLGALRIASSGLRLTDPLSAVARHLRRTYSEGVPSPALAIRLALHVASAASEPDRRTIAEELLRE